MRNKPKVISLFAGAGGMDLGFVRAGFEIAWANDNFEDAVETYRKNIGHEIVCADIEQINLEDIPDADVVIGGFPCQGFSVANMNRKVGDERNVLYKYFVKIVALKRPKFFVAENVKGLLNIDDGRVIEKIVEDFSDAGYNVKYKLLNAATFGVPQSRERVIILGVRKDIEADIEFPPKQTHAKIPRAGMEKFVSIGKALKNIPDPNGKHNLKNHEYSKYKPKFNGYISNRKVDPDKPSPTITARGDGKGGAMIMNHPHQLRRLSCREVATIQAFPLDFEFAGSMTSIYRQIGNAVPPLLGEVVATVIMDAIKKGLKEADAQTAVKFKSEQVALFA